jgi:Fe-S-cluster containining protein
MTDCTALAREIREVGFRCLACGDCCRGLGEDGSLVMVGRPEALRCADAAGLPFAETVVPYPEGVVVAGTECRLGWSLRRDAEGACRFHDGDRCTIYEARPWICRTYPFMLDGDELVVSECPGVGAPIDLEDALAIARALVERREVEEAEALRVRELLRIARLPAGETVVIDAEGVTLL